MRKSLQCVSALFVLLAGCGQSHGEPEDSGWGVSSEKASRPPGTENLLAATAPNYVTPSGDAQECLGRLIFDVRMPVQWATAYTNRLLFSSQFSAAFSDEVWDAGDVLWIGNIRIGVFGPLEANNLERIMSQTPAAQMQSLETSIKKGREYVATTRSNNKSDARELRSAAVRERGIAEQEKSLIEMKEKYKNFDAGIVGSVGYSSLETVHRFDSPTTSTIEIYLTHARHVYIFESKITLDESISEEQHKQQVLSLLKRFRTRQANEIPTELGICIPYGFIADEGTTRSELKYTFRWSDAPGVLYTIATGDVQARDLKFPPVTALARANVGRMGTADEESVKSLVSERIGPRSYKLGGLTGEQGGVALKVNKKGKEPYETYSVFTGYSGWLGSAALPFILVDMRSHTKAQAPELTQNPPPFKQSMDRLEGLLKSIRLRPTIPPMPELARLKK